MTRDDLDELMLIYAAGVAEDEERDAAESILCGGDLAAQVSYAEAQAVLASMPLALQRVEAPREIRDALLYRVAADQQKSATSIAGRQPGSDRRSAWPMYLSTGIAAALAIALTLAMLDRRDIAKNWEQSELAMKTTRQVMGSPNVSLAKLDTETKRDSYGQVLYCPVSRQYQVAVYRMQPPLAGRQYELWFITPDEKKIPAGTFDLDQFGNGMITATAPRGVEVAVTAITDEPVGGSAQPTGPIHLHGRLQTQ